MGLNLLILKQEIKRLAMSYGFVAVGVAEAGQSIDCQYSQRWIELGYQAGMAWFDRHLSLRQDCRNVFAEAKTVVVFALGYETRTVYSQVGPKIARYALGRDYHRVMKKRIQQLADQLKLIYPPLQYRIAVDSAPLDERQWAQRSGIGFLGKNGLLIHPKLGSYFVLGELLIDVILPPDEQEFSRCGKCQRCIEACPNQAITENGVDCRRCISYLTIEEFRCLSEARQKDIVYQIDTDDIDSQRQQIFSKNGIEFNDVKRKGWIFGCDICQEACPYNQHLRIQKRNLVDRQLRARIDLTELGWDSLKGIQARQFESLFQGSAIMRAKYYGFRWQVALARAELDQQSD